MLGTSENWLPIGARWLMGERKIPMRRTMPDRGKKVEHKGVSGTSGLTVKQLYINRLECAG